MASAPATAQPDTRLCNAEVESKLRELPLAEGDIKSVRVVEETNLDEFGPPILGVEGWVRLNSCSGWLVINMRPTCYILQTYTRGDCRIAGVPSSCRRAGRTQPAHRPTLRRRSPDKQPSHRRAPPPLP